MVSELTETDKKSLPNSIEIHHMEIPVRMRESRDVPVEISRGFRSSATQSENWPPARKMEEVIKRKRKKFSILRLVDHRKVINQLELDVRFRFCGGRSRKILYEPAESSPSRPTDRPESFSD